MLIVGCGCRGRALARDLVADGHAVRGTTRDPAVAAAIAAAGAEPYVGDPDRIATLMEALAGVTVVCWLMGTASGDPARVAALHDGRLRMLWEKLVDTPVRGVVHEAGGPLPEAVRGARAGGRANRPRDLADPARAARGRPRRPRRLAGGRAGRGGPPAGHDRVRRSRRGARR